jgi:hypothetical protein
MSSRRVAGNASAQTGLGADILKKMLPVVAAMAMGALSKQQRTGIGAQALEGSSSQSGLMGMLGQFLDANQDGSVVDDVIGLASKFLRK